MTIFRETHQAIRGLEFGNDATEEFKGDTQRMVQQGQ